MTDTIVAPKHTKVPRAELKAALRARDGDHCQHPDCGRIIDFNLPDGEAAASNTIDHWIPQWIIRDVPEGEPDPWKSGKIPQRLGKRSDWNEDRIWDLSNLKLMHKKCNAKKGELIPNENGTLPAKPQSTFRFRRQKRATRVGMCDVCQNGHELLGDEICASCGGNAQAFPRTHFAKFQDCDHEILWCQWCSIGDVPRQSSIAVAMRQADSDELGEYFDEE